MRHLWRAFAFQLATLLSKKFLRAVRYSKAVIKVWFIILLLAYMTEFALRLNVLKAEYESNVEFSQLFRSLHERIATSPQCEHTSPSSSACASGISKITVRVTPCQNENIKRVFECLEPLFARNENATGRGPLPTPFAAFLRCCRTPVELSVEPLPISYHQRQIHASAHWIKVPEIFKIPLVLERRC